MQISWNWLNEIIDLKGLTVENIADTLTHLGLEVEGIDQQSEGLEKVVVAQIKEKTQHPDADRLSLCQVDRGGEVLHIVCGATNMKAGDKVALAQVGATLPNGLTIKKGKIRGQESSGMLCSESELGMSAESDGIIIIDPSAEVGKPLAEVLGLDDTVLELSITPNRGDCLSHYGIARELHAKLGRPFLQKMPKELIVDQKSSIKTGLECNGATDQFFGVEIKGVQVGPSPSWLVKRLEALGSRSINNVVDITNFVLFEWGHPMHAYDADLIEGGVLKSRMAVDGEKLKLLDDSEITCSAEDVVIADANKAVGLAGVMGGGNSEVSDKTTHLFLECAEFDPIRIRKSSQRHQLHTDASHRFERGVNRSGLLRAVSRMANLIVEVCGGEVVGSCYAHSSDRVGGEGDRYRQKVQFNPKWINQFLGTPFPEVLIAQVLEGLGFQIEGPVVHVPSHRNDINIPQDLAEEVARMIGYAELKPTVPVLSEAPVERYKKNCLVQPESQVQLLDRAKDLMVQQGFLETVHYSFQQKEWLSEFGFESEVPVLNPLSEDQAVMVPSLLPGLVASLRDNFNHHFGSETLNLRLFEIRPTFHRMPGSQKIEAGPDKNLEQVVSCTGVQESWRLAFACSGHRRLQSMQSQNQDLDFFDLKGVVESLFNGLGTKGWRIFSADKTREEVPQWIHPGQSLNLMLGKGSGGWIGQFHPRLAQKLKLRQKVWLGELDWDAVSQLSRASNQWPSFSSWSEFPPMERDFALLVKEGTSAQELLQVAAKVGQPLVQKTRIFDVYRGEQVAQGMTSVAVRVIFSKEGASLEEGEIEAVAAKIVDQWKSKLGVELRN